MLYSIDDYERDVRMLLGHNCHEQPLVNDPMQLSLSQRIRAQALDAVRQAHEEAPLELLGPGLPFGDAIVWHTGGHTGHVVLPTDFHRLITFKMSDWKQAASHAINATDPAYAIQHSPWTGLRGNPERPVCAIVATDDGPALEFYSCANAACTIAQARYLPLPALDTNSRFFVSPRCLRRAIEISAQREREFNI